jgi:type IV pilus assembly protein PilC
LKSGLSFSRSFELLIENGNEDEPKILQKVYNDIISGNELWAALKKSGNFSDLDCGVIRIGEETGRLDQSLEFLNTYYNKKNEQRRILTGALSYPLIILVVAMLVLTFMILVVVPMFEQVYSRMGGDLPQITHFIIRLSAAAPAFFISFAVVIVLFFTIRHFYGKREKYRLISAKILLNLPFAGDIIRIYYQSQFCQLMHLLISSNIPLLRSLQMLEDIIRFYPFSVSFGDVSRKIVEGGSFAGNLGKYENIYSKKLVALIKVGEETNTLDKMLFQQAADITTELEYKLKQLGNMLEPLLILSIGILVAFILIAMYIPMFKLGQTIH